MFERNIRTYRRGDNAGDTFPGVIEHMDDRQISKRFSAAQAIVREAGDLAMRYFRDRDSLAVESKGAQDVVSAADRAVEAMILDRIAARFPADSVLGEETGGPQSWDGATPLWVVDPIDGTACFVNGIPVWCVSIALVVSSEIEIGVIYDPNADELFAAHRGHGATLNGVPMRPSTATCFAEGTVGIGYSPRREAAPVVQAIAQLLAEGGMFQRNGSGALMLAYVAAGRLIGYYEAHINSWDCLAALAMIREVDGWTNDFLAGDGLTRGNAVGAAAPGLAEAMQRLSGLA
jgi:myo-inositol-1(or 4)-monophosphatase